MITIDSLTKKYGASTVVARHQLHRPSRPGDRLPRPERGRQVHLDADDGRPDRRPPRAPPPSSVAGSPTCPTRAARSASCSTPRPSTPAAPVARSSPSPSGSWALPARRVAEMLELVSLTETEADRRVGNYSLGMRQRLGIAAALIGDPPVLILDEPANGLDPAGIRWMRDLLRDYADQGGTVLLSSHLLHEIEIIADDIVMIGQGRIVCPGLQGGAARGRRAPSSAPRTSSALQRALADAGVTATVARGRIAPHRRRPGRVGRAAHDGGVALTELRTADSGGLEEMFLELTADTQREEESGMTAITVDQRPPPAIDVPSPHRSRSVRVVRVELRKMFDTRSGFWLIASIVITGLDRHDRDHRVRARRGPDVLHLRQGDRLPDDGHPADDRDPVDHQRVEPAQRPDDVHLRPAAGGAWSSAKTSSSVDRGRRLDAVRLRDRGRRQRRRHRHRRRPTGVGRLVRPRRRPSCSGSLVSLLDRHHARHAAPQLRRWRWSRTSSTVLLPTCSGCWPPARTGSADLQPWVDLNFAQTFLFDGMHTGEQWAHVAVTATLWIVLPALLGLRLVMRSEVK